MKSAGLPSVLLWQGMQNRASALPILMQEAFVDDSPVPMHRVTTDLHELAALAGFVRFKRFSLYCRECIKLLELYEQQSPQRKTLAPVLLCAALRASQSLVSPLKCLIESADIYELRQARGVLGVDRANTRSFAAWVLPRLKVLLHKNLMRTHYTLGDTAIEFAIASEDIQPNNFLNLNAVAALCLGDALQESVSQNRNSQQTCLQILRLDLCCHESSERAPPKTLSDLKKRFLEISIQKTLGGLLAELRIRLQKTDKKKCINVHSSLRAFYKISICCKFMSSRQVRAIERISASAQQLALHLRCWDDRGCEANALLCLCVLALERHIELAIAVLQDLRPCERADIRLGRKVQHFIRTHRRRFRTAYVVLDSNVRELANKELLGIHQEFRGFLKLYKQTPMAVQIEDSFFHALIRFKAIALYIGEVALYELLWGLRELIVMAIERKLQLTNFLIGVLPRLSAYGLRCFVRGQFELGYDARLIGSLSEQLRAHRQIEFYKIVQRESRINLPIKQGQERKRGQRSIATTQLPLFLARNIRELIADPEAIYDCQSSQEFASLSRAVILELTLLARGARALQVDRVAALSDVLLEIYRALNGLTVLPERRVLKRNLQWAHRCLRLALNQAAARQKVCDVRPTIVSLYHFLECLHQSPAGSSDSLQAALSAVNSLAADMRGFADLFASTLDRDRSSRYQLAMEQLQGLLSTTQRLQEDLAANGMISIARWGPPLNLALGSVSNEWGKPARLALRLDPIQAPRQTVQQVQQLVKSLLGLMIEHSIESLAQRRCTGKPDTALLSVRATHSGAALNVIVEDDGSGLNLEDLASVAKEIELLGGRFSLESEARGGSHLRVAIPCTSVHWDIASKSL